MEHGRIFDQTRAIPSTEVTAWMLRLLELKPTDVLLEIGTGSGTQTEEWAKHCREVHSVEIKPYVRDVPGNVFLHDGDGRQGDPDSSHAPFDAIVCTCGLGDVPAVWLDQLAEDGRIVAPIGDNELQRLTVFRRTNGCLIPQRVAGYCRFQMMA